MSEGGARRGLGRLAVLAAAALLVVACGSSGRHTSSTTNPNTSSGSGSSTVPGVTSDSITLGTHQPLTGPAASGYSEIAVASQAFFSYVNARGGVYGRQIHLIVKDDSYNSTNTVDIVRQLVLQDKVFGIFEGLGTPTHAKVVSFLNASQVPDIFVASGCPCWDKGTTQPYTFGWQPNSTIEGKILGQYIKQHFPGEKVGVLYQDDAFGRGGLTGIEDEIPAGDVVSKQSYHYGTTTLLPQVASIAASKAKIMVDFTVPVYTAIAQVMASKVGYRPRLVASSAGIDPTTVGGLIKTISRSASSGTASLEGAITDDYLPAPTDTSNPWIRLFMKIRAQYDPNVPLDGNVEYGMAIAYTLVQALESTGKDLTRQALINTIDKEGASWAGPGLVPFSYSTADHGGYSGAEIGKIQGGKLVLSGGPLTTTPASSSAITPYTGTQAAPPASGIPASR